MEMDFYLIDDFPIESDQTLHLCVGFDPQTANFVLAQDDLDEDGAVNDNVSVITISLNEMQRLGQFVEAVIQSLLSKEGHSVQ